MHTTEPSLTSGQPASPEFIQMLARLQKPSRQRRWPSGVPVAHVDAIRAEITRLLERDRAARGNDDAAQYGLQQTARYLATGEAFGASMRGDGEFLFFLRRNLANMNRRRY